MAFIDGSFMVFLGGLAASLQVWLPYAFKEQTMTFSQLSMMVNFTVAMLVLFATTFLAHLINRRKN